MTGGDTPSRARRLAHRGQALLRETGDLLREALRGRPAVPLPPRWLRDVGPGDFEATGREFLRHFIEIGSLRPHERVLEIGCGPGRMALPLTRYLAPEGLYAGVDVVAPAIRWCQRNISSRHPHFSFHHADVHNARYNPAGTIRAETYRFPFDGGSFDFVFLTSVLTHMRPHEIRHYLGEIVRVLRGEGRLLCTLFLLNPAQKALADQGRGEIEFPWDCGSFRTRDESLPESAVALEEAVVLQMLDDSGLAVCEPVHHGRWSGREDGLSLQDIVVARRLQDIRADRP